MPPLDAPLIVEEAAGPTVTINGKECLNLASTNFLGIANSKYIRDAAAKAIKEYGVGSCGPRGFYGTIDVHAQLERTMAKFMNTEDAILYSDGIAGISSVIPAFAKQGDLLVVDEGVNFAIQRGIRLSRSNVVWFKHNNMEDLRTKLNEIAAKDRFRSKPQRRFIVVEGLYQNYGDIAPLNEIVALAKNLKFRTILDDSMALGVLGKTGRGTMEHFGLATTDIDIVSSNLDHSVASVGGICVGTQQVVHHQRLSGLGYCFSAASPPYTAEAGRVALHLIDANPQLCALVREKALFFRQALCTALKPGTGLLSPIVLPSPVEPSPVVHLRLVNPSAHAYLGTPREIMNVVVRKLREDHNIIAVCPSYAIGERFPAAPSLRLNVTAEHADADLRVAAAAVAQVFKQVLSAESLKDVQSAAPVASVAAAAPAAAAATVESSTIQVIEDSEEEEEVAPPPQKRSGRRASGSRK